MRRLKKDPLKRWHLKRKIKSENKPWDNPSKRHSRCKALGGGQVLSQKCFKEAMPWLISSQPTLIIIIWKPLPSIVSQSVQLLSRVWLFVTPWTAAHQASLSFTNSRSLLKLMSIELVMPSNHLIFCHSRFLLPSIFPSTRVFSNESVLHIRWPNGVSASASVLPMNVQDWFHLGLTGLIFLNSKELSRVFSNTTVQNHQFFGAQFSLWSNSYIHTSLLEKPQLWLDGPLSVK